MKKITFAMMGAFAAGVADKRVVEGGKGFVKTVEGIKNYYNVVKQ